jgi:hypothetical protein
MRSRSGPDPSELIVSMREEFRRHLESFYAGLHLAAPYDSVEKALVHLTRTLTAMSAEERGALASQPSGRFRQYTTVFAECGLAQKHRGIIAGLIRSGQVTLPPDYHPWLELCGRDTGNTQKPGG